jgi:hypothetical protein
MPLKLPNIRTSLPIGRTSMISTAEACVDEKLHATPPDEVKPRMSKLLELYDLDWVEGTFRSV